MAAGSLAEQPVSNGPAIELPPSSPPLSAGGPQQTSASDQAVVTGQNHVDSSDVPKVAQTATEAAAQGLWLPAPEVLGGLDWRWLATHESDWSLDRLSPTLNLRLDGRIVPSAAAGGARVSFSHLVVLDGFFGEPERQELAGFLTGQSAASGEADDKNAASIAADESADDRDGTVPGPRWERATADRAGLPPTWGLKEDALRELATAEMAAVREVHTRLARLYPEYAIAHMPSAAIQQQGYAQGSRLQPATCSTGEEQAATATAADRVAEQRDEVSSPPCVTAAGLQDISPAAADCDQFVGNAAVYGDCFRWHVDADPAGFPAPSPWTDAFGDYCNGEPGRPLLVSLLLYLDAGWPRDWAAETLFLDDGTNCGVAVRPRPYRAVLMDQDVLHRVSTPSQLAGGRPRLSLVWKLAVLPRTADAAACLARPDWGPSTAFGSAARLEAVQRSVASRKRKAGLVQ